MLVLSRNVNQSIVIGENITVTVLEPRCGRTRLGITAPKEVPVHREEIKRAIDQQSETAASSQGPGVREEHGSRTPRKHWRTEAYLQLEWIEATLVNQAEAIQLLEPGAIMLGFAERAITRDEILARHQAAVSWAARLKLYLGQRIVEDAACVMPALQRSGVGSQQSGVSSEESAVRESNVVSAPLAADRRPPTAPSPGDAA